jgi:phenylacetate-CoA ligase
MLLRKIYYLRKVLQNQWKKPEELKKIQNKMLRRIILHAYKNTVFYRKLWKKNSIDVESIKTVEDLRKLPVISKLDLIKNYNQFLTTNLKLKRMIMRTTSGTSGVGMKVPFDEKSWDYLEAIYLRSLLAAGYDPRKPLAYYWYTPFEKTIHERLGFMKKILIPCRLTEEQQIKILQKINPEYIYYFSSSIFSIAKKMKKEGIEIIPKCVITHAEVLSDKMRNTIENAFQAPVFDQYGTAEFIRVAWECNEKTGYHVDADSTITEILKDDEPVSSGERGSAVFTCIANDTFPLIRYKIGDIFVATDDKCNCGRNLPLIKSIEGREKDLIKLKSGKILYPKMVIDSIADIDQIYKFRVQYLGKNHFVVNLVCFEEYGIEQMIKNKLQRVIREDIKVEVEQVEEISKGKTGKRELVMVKIKV